MKIPTELERASLHQAARLWRALPPTARHALTDPAVRDALNQTYVNARRIYDDVRDENAAVVGRRMAQDARLQKDVAQLVRSAARAVDRSRTSARRQARRRARRRMLWLALLAGVGIAVARTITRPAERDRAADITVRAAPSVDARDTVAGQQ